MKRWVFLLLIMVSALAATSAYAQEPPPDVPTDDEVNAVAKNMYCPVCENVPLDVCPTLACEQWRGQIRELLSQGYGEQEIHDYFAAQYGDRVLAFPPRTGLNRLLYIVPPVVILLAAILLYFGFRRWRQTPAIVGDEQVQAALDDEYVSRIEEELARRD